MQRSHHIGALVAVSFAVDSATSCGSSSADGGTAPKTPTLSVTPAIVAAAPNVTIDLAAVSDDGGPVNVTWRVNGVTGGSSPLGTISASGAYKAPAIIPAGDSVVVTAVAAGDTTIQRSCTVFFVPDLSSKDYDVALPRVVDVARQTRTRFLVVPPIGVSSVSYLPTSGNAVPLTPIGNGVLTFELEANAALAAYVPGTLHSAVGRLDYRTSSGTSVKTAVLSVNVRESSVPDVPVASLAPDAQRSAYVLNLRVDTASINVYGGVVARALQLLGDQFDFMAVIATVTSNNNRNYTGIRNDIRGIGTPIFDNSNSWGGGRRLRGAISFPIDTYFDGADAGMIHETGHAWIAFGTDSVLRGAVPHWPPSTMAHGIMGFSIGPTAEGGVFPWQLTPLGDGTVRITSAAASDRFTPLDLYLMGLVPPDSVPDNYVLPSTVNPSTIVNGMTSPAITYTIADYIAGQGARVPASAAAPREFATAVVVLTYGRLLTAAEMAFFDAAVSRAETRVPLQSSIGFATGPASGFYLATGGRATLRTRLP